MCCIYLDIYVAPVKVPLKTCLSSCLLFLFKYTNIMLRIKFTAAVQKASFPVFQSSFVIIFQSIFLLGPFTISLCDLYFIINF